jgi:hypothetical protein
VDAVTAANLVENGGFYVLLDGLNEARDTELVRIFVKSILRNNTVIVSSQFDPEWIDIIKRNIDLRPFGKQQLRFLLNDDQLVEKVIQADYLFDINQQPDGQGITAGMKLLPFTATLIKEYIEHNHGEIPPSRLAIYERLLERLKQDPQYINFEKKAWEMFCNNSQNLEPDDEEDNIDKLFLQRAKDGQVLTEFVVKNNSIYRFRHERIFRFVVTTYLYRLYKLPDFGSLHKQLTKGQDTLYWSDVIEFLGELFMEEAERSGSVTEYKFFLIKTGVFEPLILKKRLITQWNQLCNKMPVTQDAGFNAQLLNIISQEGKEI